MKRHWRLWLFLLVLALALTVLVPLQWLLGGLDLPRLGLSAREATGTLWQGGLRGAAWHGQALGDLQVRLQPLPLLGGTRALHISGERVALRLLQGRRNGVDDVNGMFVGNIASLPGIDIELRAAGVAVVFADGRCQQADGQMQASLSLTGQDTPMAMLTGTPQCADRTAVLVLRQDSGSARIEATVRIEADGRYRLQNVVRDADPALSVLLQQAGFTEGPAGLSQTHDGQLAGIGG